MWRDLGEFVGNGFRMVLEHVVGKELDGVVRSAKYERILPFLCYDRETLKQ